MHEHTTPHDKTHIHIQRNKSPNGSEFEPQISKNDRKIATIILNSGCVKYNADKPFELDSGVLSPIYIDNRLILSNPNFRNIIIEHLTEEILEIGIPDVVAGVATAGIPYAAILAEKLDLPMVYVRPQPKTHGMQNQIEGRIKRGQIVVVIEDQISTAGSSIRVIKELKNQGAVVKDEIAIITRGTKQSIDNLEKAKVKLHAMTNLESVLQVAAETCYFNQEQIKVVRQWLEDPENWGK